MGIFDTDQEVDHIKEETVDLKVGDVNEHGFKIVEIREDGDLVVSTQRKGGVCKPEDFSDYC